MDSQGPGGTCNQFNPLSLMILESGSKFNDPIMSVHVNIATDAIAIAHEARQKAETSEEIAKEAKREAADAKQIGRGDRDSADNCDTKIYLLECEMNKLKKKVAEAEDYSRKHNLTIDGLQASLNETDAQLKQNVYQLLKKSG